MFSDHCLDPDNHLRAFNKSAPDAGSVAMVTQPHISMHVLTKLEKSAYAPTILMNAIKIFGLRGTMPTE
jgi:hypothetical protein